jgi:hypothetical protein
MKKIIFLLIIILLLVGVVGFLLYNFLQLKPAVNNQNSANINQIPQSSNENINQIDVGSYTEDVKLMQKAVDERDAKYCSQVKEMKIDDCLYLVAISVSRDVCQQISDMVIKEECLEYYEADKSLVNNDLGGCLALSDDEFKKNCLVQLFIQQNDLAYCNDLQTEDKILCEDLINKNIAVKEVNQEICEKIQDQGVKSDCINTIDNLPKDSDKDGIQDYLERSYGLDPFKADSDGDGLSDYDEIFKYKTNPTKADTDDDGYSDGEEVKNGYNPLGN